MEDGEAVHDDWLGLRGARVLIAGAGGIGAACALGFARAGCDLLVVDRDPSALERLAAHNDLGDAAGQALEADLGTPGGGARVVEAALSRLGGLDVVVHSIGINERRPVLELGEEDWDRVLAVNLSTVFGLAQAAGRHLVAQGSGRVIAMSSVSGSLAHRLHGAYAASKGGMNQLLRVMAAEWAPSGVTVNMIAPGYTETSLTREHLEKPGVRDALVELVPAGRLGEPEDVVGAALFLSSAHARFITGHILYVDGGRTLV
jgi:NAD(P)-dependent dehydrogenase (short-subunit alcohol dehydrogenase family)